MKTPSFKKAKSYYFLFRYGDMNTADYQQENQFANMRMLICVLDVESNAVIRVLHTQFVENTYSAIFAIL